MSDAFKMESIYVPVDQPYPIGAVRLTKAEDRLISFVPLNGGWVRKIPVEEFNEHFRPATAAEMDRPPYRPGLFEIDDYFEPAVAGFTQDFLWNGWSTPVFEFDQAKRIADVFGDITYDTASDTFILNTEDMDEPEYFKGELIVVDGQSKRVYPIGSGYWCWDEATEDTDD